MIKKKYAKRIQKELREKYPDDPAIARLTLKEITRVTGIVSSNVKYHLYKGRAVPFNDYFTLFVAYTKDVDIK